MKLTMDDIAKYGVMPLLIFAIFWLNNRLTAVENDLRVCMKEQILIYKEQRSATIDLHPPIVAILPKPIRIEKATNRHA